MKNLIRLLYSAALIALASSAHAQTAQTRASLYTEITNDLPSGNPAYLTSAQLRQVFKDVVASSSNPLTDTTTGTGAWVQAVGPVLVSPNLGNPVGLPNGIIYSNGTGFSAVTIGSNLSFTGGTLNATSNATGLSLVRSITQSNSFTLGECVFNNNGTWTASDSSAYSTAHVDGVVTATGNPFTVNTNGYENTITGLAANTQYYLGTAGALTTTPPSTPGSGAYVVSVLKTGVAGDGQIQISNPASLAIIPVVDGGTGVGTITGIPYGTGTSALGTVTIGSGLSFSGGTLSATGGSSGTALTQSVSQTNSFTLGQAVYFNGTSWALSEANALSTSTVHGVITATGNPFTVTLVGLSTAALGLSANSVYYLSDATPGLLTTTAPTSATSYVVQVATTGSTASAYIQPDSPATLALIPVSAGGTGSATLPDGITAYVSNAHGNDGTAALGNRSLPFATPLAAYNAINALSLPYGRIFILDTPSVGYFTMNVPTGGWNYGISLCGFGSTAYNAATTPQSEAYVQLVLNWTSNTNNNYINLQGLGVTLQPDAAANNRIDDITVFGDGQSYVVLNWNVTSAGSASAIVINNVGTCLVAACSSTTGYTPNLTLNNIGICTDLFMTTTTGHLGACTLHNVWLDALTTDIFYYSTGTGATVNGNFEWDGGGVLSSYGTDAPFVTSLILGAGGASIIPISVVLSNLSMTTWTPAGGTPGDANSGFANASSLMFQMTGSGFLHATNCKDLSVVQGTGDTTAYVIKGCNNFQFRSSTNPYPVTTPLSGTSFTNLDNPAALTQSVTQANSFTLGQAVYYNGTSWALSEANALSTSVVHGVVTATGNPFTVTLFGLSTASLGLSANTVYYLSDATAGLLTSTAPTSTTSYVVQVATTGSTGAAYISPDAPASLALIPVSAGGTGASTLTGVLIGNGTSAVTATTSLTGLTYNGLTLTANATGFQIAGGTTSKTLVVSNSLTLAGTDSTVMTFPSTSATIARTDAAQTFTGVETFSSAPILSSLTGLLVGNGASAVTTITPGTGVAAALAQATNAASGFVTYSGTLGSPTATSLTVQNATSLGGTTYSYGALPSGATTAGTVLTVPATTYTVTGTNTATNFQASYHGVPTFTNASAGVVTDLFTDFWQGPPVVAGSQTATRLHSLGILDSTAAASSITGALVISSTLGTTTTSIGMGNGAINMGSNLTVGGTSTLSGAVSVNNSLAVTGSNSTTALTITQTARTSGALPYIKWTIPTDTGLTASTEAPGLVSVTGTRTWATTGTVATQRENLFVAPTYASASASQTFTTAATFDITGAPIAGTNAIITNPWALRVEAGNSTFGGLIQYGGLVRTTAAFTATSNTTLANITALSVNVAAAQNYHFRVWAPTTATTAGGIQFAIAGTATATNITYEGYIDDANKTRSSALATAVCSSATATTGTATIEGTIQVNAAGTLTVQFAQNTSNASASSVLQGATFEVWQTSN